MDSETCVCGHVYDEHDNGEECQVMVVYRGQEQRCACVYFEATDDDE